MHAPPRPRVWAIDAQPARPTGLPGFPRLAEIQQQIRQMQEENAALKVRLSSLEKKRAGEQNLPVPAWPQTCQTESVANSEETQVEERLRQDLAWLDEPCPFKKAGGRTWRMVAENQGDKIPMNGRGLQVPRAYLHSIENWAEAGLYVRMKSKLALALCHNVAMQ